LYSKKEFDFTRRRALKKMLLVLFFVTVPAALFAAPVPERPHWSLELKGGLFTPDIENWSGFYESRDINEYSGAVAYKIFRGIEVGVEGTCSRASGSGFAPIHTQLNGGIPVLAGQVVYQVCPINVFVLTRGIFTEGQWVVPYAGGGWTRIFYREEVKNQGKIARGSVNGYHARAGIQLLLDNLDPNAANSFYLDYGVFHTYLFLEARYTRAMVDTVNSPSESINLGGTSWLGGLLFEF
jgi:hypothetical protein